MAETVRIGFIGCGGNARSHIKRLQELPDVQIAGVCDVVEEAARKAAEETGAEPYTDHRRMLDRGDLDAVYLSLPVFAHGRPEFDVIERRLPFLVEKPVALDLPTAREIESLVRKHDLLTAVGYQLRYGETVDRAKQILEGQRLGLLSGKYWCNSGAGDPGHWLRQMGRSGGQLVEQATHTVDIMRCLGGEIAEVYCASTQQVLRDIDCPDFNAVTIRFENGAVGSLTTSWCLAQGWSNANVVDILFEDALMHWSVRKLVVYRDGEAHEEAGTVPNIDDIFVQAVRTGDRSLIRSPYSDGVTTLAVTLAMNQSAREDRPVRIADMA